MPPRGPAPLPPGPEPAAPACGPATSIMPGRPAQGRSEQRGRAAIGHALAFATWRSLTREQGLDDTQAADLMCRLADAAARESDKPKRSRRRDQGHATAPSPT